MDHTIQEVIFFIEQNDVKFIRLAFCDVYGVQKNISIMPSQIQRAFTEGISFDANAIAGFELSEGSDLVLIPDASTLDILPWRPQSGRVVRFFCQIRYPDGTIFERDSRHLLQQKLQEVRSLGYHVMCGMECEFYLCKLEEKGSKTKAPIDQGGYFDLSPKDQGENIRRNICLTLEEMGIHPERSHHEQGPGQNEIDFHYAEALTSCDRYQTFRWIVENVANQHQAHAVFTPKPFPEESGNGLHIHLSLANNNHNAFTKEEPLLLYSFIAGILAHITEITCFLNPDAESYQRLKEKEAPGYVDWSYSNRSTLIRIPAVKDHRLRCEVRSPDAICNPYLALTLLIAAGMEGIKQNLELSMEMNTDPVTLPSSLEEAIQIAKASSFVKEHLPQTMIAMYTQAR